LENGGVDLDQLFNFLSGEIPDSIRSESIRSDFSSVRSSTGESSNEKEASILDEIDRQMSDLQNEIDLYSLRSNSIIQEGQIKHHSPTWNWSLFLNNALFVLLNLNLFFTGKTALQAWQIWIKGKLFLLISNMRLARLIIFIILLGKSQYILLTISLFNSNISLILGKRTMK
jgi:hypothetical protein